MRRGVPWSITARDDQMVFQKRWIAWNQYELYFHGKPRKTKVSGFHFVQPE